MPLRGKGIIRIHHTILSTNLSKTKKKRKEKEAKRSTTSHVGEILLLPLCMIQNTGGEKKQKIFFS
jgi:hypothetical protein